MIDITNLTLGNSTSQTQTPEMPDVFSPPSMLYDTRPTQKSEQWRLSESISKLTLRLHRMPWGVKTTCFKAPGVSLGGSGVSIGGVRSLRVLHLQNQHSVDNMREGEALVVSGWSSTIRLPKTHSAHRKTSTQTTNFWGSMLGFRGIPRVMFGDSI